MTSLLSGIRFSGGDEDFPEGISVIICTRNATSRIGQTLRHLARQKVSGLPWEIIIVDNGSTDETAEMARREWPVDAPVPLRIFYEPTPGYNYAAEHGISHARYSVISHVHDDNWLEEDWIARVAAIFRSNPEIGACGGRTKANFECLPPAWFSKFQENYAIGPQSERGGDITWSRGYLWGAGLSVRRTAWMQLKQRGFRSRSSGRKAGQRLISGEDSEICYALRLAGWKLWYCEDLQLTHHIPATRLNWQYLRRLFRSFGGASALHDCYFYPLSHVSLRCDGLWREALMKSLSQLLWRVRRAGPALFWTFEGNADLLQLEREIGRTVQLIRMRNAYAQTHRAVFDAEWREKPKK